MSRYERLEAQETREVELPFPCTGARVTVRRITVHAGRRIAMYVARVEKQKGDTAREYARALVCGVPDKDIATPPAVLGFSGMTPEQLIDAAELTELPPTWQEQLVELLVARDNVFKAVTDAIATLREEWEQKKFGSPSAPPDS